MGHDTVNKRGSGLAISMALSLGITLYALSGPPVQVMLLLLLAVATFLWPEIGLVVLATSFVYDSLLVIPLTGKSIAYVCAICGFVGLLARGRVPRVNLALSVSLVLLFVVAVYGYYRGQSAGASGIGYGDPSRGVVFSAGLTYFCLLVGQRSDIVLPRVLRLLPTLVLTFLLSVPVSLLRLDYLSTQGRFQASLGDPNYFARATLLCAVVSMTWFKSWGSRVVILAISAVLVLASQSKTGLLCLILFIVAVLFEHRRSKWAIMTVCIVGVCYSVLLISGLAAHTLPTVFGRFLPGEIARIGLIDITNPIDALTSGRTLIWRLAFQAMGSSRSLLLLGIGIGAGPELVAPAFGYAVVLHNGILDVMLETGLVGLAVVAMCLILAVKAVRSRGEAGESQLIGILSSILFIVFTMTLSGFWTKSNLSVVLVILAIVGTYKGEYGHV